MNDKIPDYFDSYYCALCNTATHVECDANDPLPEPTVIWDQMGVYQLPPHITVCAYCGGQAIYTLSLRKSVIGEV